MHPGQALELILWGFFLWKRGQDALYGQAGKMPALLLKIEMLLTQLRSWWVLALLLCAVVVVPDCTVWYGKKQW